MQNNDKSYISRVLIISLIFNAIIAFIYLSSDKDLTGMFFLFLATFSGDIIVAGVAGTIAALIVSKVKEQSFSSLLKKWIWYMFIVWMVVKVVLGAIAIYDFIFNFKYSI